MGTNKKKKKNLVAASWSRITKLNQASNWPYSFWFQREISFNINGVMGLDQLAHDASQHHNVDQSLSLKGLASVLPLSFYDHDA